MPENLVEETAIKDRFILVLERDEELVRTDIRPAIFDCALKSERNLEKFASILLENYGIRALFVMQGDELVRDVRYQTRGSLIPGSDIFWRKEHQKLPDFSLENLKKCWGFRTLGPHSADFRDKFVVPSWVQIPPGQTLSPLFCDLDEAEKTLALRRGCGVRPEDPAMPSSRAVKQARTLAAVTGLLMPAGVTRSAEECAAFILKATKAQEERIGAGDSLMEDGPVWLMDDECHASIDKAGRLNLFLSPRLVEATFGVSGKGPHRVEVDGDIGGIVSVSMDPSAGNTKKRTGPRLRAYSNSFYRINSISSLHNEIGQSFDKRRVYYRARGGVVEVSPVFNPKLRPEAGARKLPPQESELPLSLPRTEPTGAVPRPNPEPAQGAPAELPGMSADTIPGQIQSLVRQFLSEGNVLRLTANGRTVVIANAEDINLEWAKIEKWNSFE